jgi:hypothetical protein
MVSQKSGSKAQRIAKRAIATIAVLGFMTLGGCSSTEPSATTQANLAQTELHFDLNQCQDLGGGLYKCPASDKPICNPGYNGTVECVRLGPKGSVFVSSPVSN